MTSQIKPKLKNAIDIVAKPFSFLNPNAITIMGLVAPIAFLFLMMRGYYAWAILALIGSAFDMLDGAVARLTSRETEFGGVLDSTLDRFSDATFISAFGFAGIVRWDIIIPVIIFSFMVSYIRSRAELAGGGRFILNVGLMERTERTILLLIALIAYIIYPDIIIWSFNLSEIVFSIQLVLTFITVIQRFYHAYRELD